MRSQAMRSSGRLMSTNHSQTRGNCLQRAAILALAAVCFGPVPAALAGNGVWTTNGPYGVGVQALAVVAPDTLYAGTVFGGVFKSTDGGDSWSAINTGLSSTNIFTLQVDPAKPTTLYAGSVLDGVFKSTDGGDTWDAAGKTPIGYALAIDPTDADTLYVGTVNGVFKTVDGGGTWNSSGLADVNVSLVVIDPTVPGTLYAGTVFDGVFRSTDAGATWSATGLHPGAFALALDPGAPGTLYAGTAAGVFKSSDHGDTWTATGPNHSAVVYALASDRDRPGTVYAGVMYADGSGAGGVFVTMNGGASWTLLDNGLSNTAVGALVVDATVVGRLYAATGGGVFEIERAASPMPECARVGAVTVNDVVIMVDIALGNAPPGACANGVGRAGDIDVASIIRAVERALRGVPLA